MDHYFLGLRQSTGTLTASAAAAGPGLGEAPGGGRRQAEGEVSGGASLIDVSSAAATTATTIVEGEHMSLQDEERRLRLRVHAVLGVHMVDEYTDRCGERVLMWDVAHAYTIRYGRAQHGGS